MKVTLKNYPKYCSRAIIHESRLAKKYFGVARELSLPELQRIETLQGKKNNLLNIIARELNQYTQWRGKNIFGVSESFKAGDVVELSPNTDHIKRIEN